MIKAVVVYATDYGSTKKLAEAVVDGVKSVEGADAIIKSTEEVTSDDLTSSDALIFGTPVHMGSADWRIKKLIDIVCSKLWMENALAGKVGAVFATGSGFGNAGGGTELAMLLLLSNFAELGMVIVPLPKNTPGYARGGIQWGPYGRTADDSLQPIGLSDEAIETARHHGANVARVAKELKGKNLFAS